MAQISLHNSSKGGEGGKAAGVVREHRLRGAAAAVVVGAEPAGAAQGLEDPLRIPARRGAAPEGTVTAQAGKSYTSAISLISFASGTVEQFTISSQFSVQCSILGCSLRVSQAERLDIKLL